MIKYIFAVSILMQAVLCALAPTVLWAEDGPQVRVIEIEGLRRIDPTTVKERISHPIDEPVSTEAVTADIKAIYSMGYFDDVKAVLEPFEGGLKLVYVVKEKPTLRSVEFFGNEALDETKIKEAVTISPGSIADTVLIRDNAEKLKGLYEAEGYPSAVVTPVLREVSEGYVLLTYYIQEGQRVKIDNITIEGNNTFSDFEVKKSMQTSEWWILSFLGKGGRYSRPLLQADRENVKRFYNDRGYIQAEVFEPQLEFSEDKQRLNISLTVYEGEQFRVSEIGFSGNTVFSDKELREKLKIEVGDPVGRSTLGDDVQTLTEMYTERGYALASVVPNIVPNEAARTAKITFRVSEGDIFHIGRIDIKGNVSTMDKVIRRQMRLNEGDIFNSKLLRRSYERLINLNFFENVKLNPKPDSVRKRLDMDIDVTEKSTGFLNVGAGYSSVDNFIGMFEIAEANLGGRGQYIKLKSSFSSKSSTYELSFREPWLFDRPVALDLSVYSSTRRYDEYSKDSKGGSMGLTRNFADYWSVGATYRYEKATIYDVQRFSSALISSQEGTRYTSSITPSLARDSRDNYLNPHRGSENKVYVTYAGLGGTNKYYKLGVESSVYFPVTEKTTFGVHGLYGKGEGLEGQELPLYERFNVGNIYTVRGLRDIGPIDDRGDYIGGKQRLIFNFEYTFPLASEVQLRGVVFFDTGTAYDRYEDIDWRNTAGTGIRWISPIGPVRLEWARVLRPRRGESRYKWEFAIGTMF
jgi:outer membrane protein insertion porin family